MACLSEEAQHRFDFLLEDLDRETTDAKSLFAYDRGAKYLWFSYDAPDFDYVLKFSAKIGPEFVELIVNNDPRALTIVGYFFMLMKTTDIVDWLPRPTKKEFNVLMSKLPEEWKPRMAWAVREFENCSD
ncbi:hypothetical protein DL98DRAFT_106782 [Cadophora sp. DSE1049]|nr:hypothetical protein DL98DRAFT_106782 [Cadophora sp. DSE1049]